MSLEDKMKIKELLPLHLKATILTVSYGECVHFYVLSAILTRGNTFYVFLFNYSEELR